MAQPLNSDSKKMCLIGASGVGKTSLVKRFIEGRFDKNYRTTIGAHMYDKFVICDEKQVKLNIWDLEGRDDSRSEYPVPYLKGAQGYMLVADVTRPDTLDVAKDLLSTIGRQRKELTEDDPPVVLLLLNKQDLLQEDLMQSCRVTEQAQKSFGHDVKLFKTSAKLDEEVGQAFNYLVEQMLEVDRQKGSSTYELKDE